MEETSTINTDKQARTHTHTHIGTQSYIYIYIYSVDVFPIHAVHCINLWMWKQKWKVYLKYKFNFYIIYFFV